MSVESNRSAGNVPRTCDSCGVENSLARYCAYNDAMTHREVVWLCDACHPNGA